MTLFYHGTPAGRAIKIARDGAILSPWEQEIIFLRQLKEKNPNSYKKITNKNNGMDEEETALELAKIGYAARETEERIKCVSLTSDKSWLIAPHYEIILGIELEHPPQDGALFVPRKVPLDTLTEVHYKTREQEIRTAFAKYKPKFIKF
ncbi:Uncharacterised protein [uncultured archaeon]|nr:Uncharacterised protein [uncultured archaeon]